MSGACAVCNGTGTVEREVNRVSPKGEFREDVPVLVVCEECDGSGEAPAVPASES